MSRNLLKMLRLLGTVECEEWTVCQEICKQIGDRNAEVLESRWTTSYKDEEDVLDLTIIDTWSTSFGDLEFSADKKGSIICNARIRKSILGDYPSPWFVAKIKLPKSFISEIKYFIERDFDVMLSRRFSEFQLEHEEKWKKECRALLLSSQS